jgi:UDP-galactopyranose mutase
MYDFLVVGSGITGATFAHILNKYGFKVLIIDERSHIGGNSYSKTINGIETHVYGCHIFHTLNKKIWQFVNQFETFNNYQHKVIANYKNELYSFPFNLSMFKKLWGCQTPKEAQYELNKRRVNIPNPKNLEEYALSNVGQEIYDKFIYGYTKKQWMCEPKKLPVDILKRLPIRYNDDDNYYTDGSYQGIPNSYTDLIGNMIDGIDLQLNMPLENIKWNRVAKKIYYTGSLDRFFNYELGELPYRTLNFVSEVHKGNYQKTAVVNYTEEQIPFTRIVEHKNFINKKFDHTIITKEYPVKWTRNSVPYYPINTSNNEYLYSQYVKKAKDIDGLVFGGRLGKYNYLDLDQAINLAINQANKQLIKR